MINVYSDFLDDFAHLVNYAGYCKFEDIENPVDRVVYPYICDDIPDNIERDVVHGIATKTGYVPGNITMFLRMSPKGVHVPHPVHHDLSMGRYSLMLYLQSAEMGGTGFYTHIESGIRYAPTEQPYIDLIANDSSDMDKWDMYMSTQMNANEAVIFDAGLMHGALPAGGFGTDQTNARIVLTAFFT